MSLSYSHTITGYGKALQTGRAMKLECYYNVHNTTHTSGPLDGTSMNKECAAVDAVGSMPPL